MKNLNSMQKDELYIRKTDDVFFSTPSPLPSRQQRLAEGNSPKYKI